jgi:DNA-binding NarL/FixJ family response regulator
MKVTLSARQTQVLQFLLIGYRQTEIAQELGISAKSVHTHIRFAADKFGIKRLSNGGHAELIAKAKEFVRSPGSLGDA